MFSSFEGIEGTYIEGIEGIEVLRELREWLYPIYIGLSLFIRSIHFEDIQTTHISLLNCYHGIRGVKILRPLLSSFSRITKSIPLPPYSNLPPKPTKHYSRNTSILIRIPNLTKPIPKSLSQPDGQNTVPNTPKTSSTRSHAPPKFRRNQNRQIHDKHHPIQS